MPAWIAGGIAGAGLLGDLFSSSSAAATNTQNMQIAQMNNQFNAQQSQLNRDWQTQMSNTAMQRRVEDLKSAGLNPMLAIGQGGASQPAGASAQSAGLPQLMNPGASFGNLGNIAASAASADASIDLMHAQATKTRSETPSETGEPAGDEGEITVRDASHALGNATVDNIRTQIGVGQETAKQIQANVGYIHSQVTNLDENTALQRIQEALTGQQRDVIAGTKAYIIRQAKQAADHGDTKTWVNTGTLGKVLGVLNGVAGPISSAVGAALGGAAGSAIRGGAKAITPDPLGKLPTLSQ